MEPPVTSTRRKVRASADTATVAAAITATALRPLRRGPRPRMGGARHG